MKNIEQQKTWEDYYDLICGAFVKTVKAVLALARICADADASLEPDDYLRLENALPFGIAKMSMLRQIGADDRLYQKKVMSGCRQATR